jgi:hypothetical protein
MLDLVRVQGHVAIRLLKGQEIDSVEVMFHDSARDLLHPRGSWCPLSVPLTSRGVNLDKLVCT